MKFPRFALSFISAAVVSVSAAEAQNHPWCSMVDLGDEILNCGFDSLEQCKASLSGGGDRCIENNTYKPPPPESVSAKDTSAPAQAPLSPAKKTQRHSTARSPVQGTGWDWGGAEPLNGPHPPPLRVGQGRPQQKPWCVGRSSLGNGRGWAYVISRDRNWPGATA